MRKHVLRLATPAAMIIAMVGCNPLDPLRVVDEKQKIVDMKISPKDTTVVAGATVNYTVTVTGNGGKVITDRIVTWAVGNPVVASIKSDSGTATAKVAGKSDIFATVEHYRVSTSLTVTPAPVPTLKAP